MDNLKSLSNELISIPDDNCYFHPLPNREKLPSGLQRTRPKKAAALTESSLNMNKQRRAEERAARQHGQMTHSVPECAEHKFCIPNAPDSPKVDEADHLPQKV